MATLKQLTNEINAEVSNSCSLPYSLPEAEVHRIINRAKEWFYMNYGQAVEEKYLALPYEIFEHPTFKATRMINLPDCVVAVYELREMTGIGILGQQNGDFSDSKLLGTDIFLSPFQGDNLVYKTAMYSMFDLAKAYTIETIAYRYNRNTKRISILGRDPHRDCFIRVGSKIPEESLFNDELFVRYCFAQAKINLGRILQLFQFNLPGGVGINLDVTKQDGLAELADIKAEIDSQNSPDFFIQF